MKKSARVGGHKSFALPPSTPRTALFPLIAEEKKNNIKGLALIGKAKELHTDVTPVDGDRQSSILPEHEKQARTPTRGKFEPTRLEDYFNMEGFQMEEFRQGGFSLMVRGDRNNTSSSFQTSRSVRSVCSSEDLIVTSIKLSPNEKENGYRSQPRVSPKSQQLPDTDSHVIEITPCRFLINGKEVKMPDVPPPSMRSAYKPYHNPQNGAKFYSRMHLERFRRPQRTSPRPRTVPIVGDGTTHFVPIQLKKSNKVAFENYLNNSAKPKSATLHRRPDARGTPTRNKHENEDTKAATSMQLDMKFSSGGQEALAGKILHTPNHVDQHTVFLGSETERDVLSKATLINQWLDDCEQQRTKKTLVLSFPSIGEEVEDGEEE
ncbi:uncharacterized protein LOC144350256 isoform X2 [Saccoglossus kowalevskii]